MTESNHLCDIWEHTIVNVFNHDSKSKLGLMFIQWIIFNQFDNFNSVLGAVPNKQTDLASWINLGPTHFIICICHNTLFSKNSQMLGILCIYSKKEVKGGSFVFSCNKILSCIVAVCAASHHNCCLLAIVNPA